MKPLYWTTLNNTLLFASEIKAFLAHPMFECRLSTENIDEYMAFRYCAEDRHLLQGVHQLRPGHLMRFTAGTRSSAQQFYEIPEREEDARIEQDALSELESRLRDSVQSQLLGDVKIGCQLSGGIDSSLTTLFTSAHQRERTNSFSITLTGSPLSEEKWVAQAVQRANVKGHCFSFDKDEFLEALDPATWHLEQPINHPNTLGIFHLAKKSKPSVKVLLSGEGADELMGGYNRFYYSAIRDKVRPLLPILCKVPSLKEKINRNFGTSLKDKTSFFMAASVHMRPDQLVQLRPDAQVESLLEQRRVLFDEGKGDHISNCMKYEMRTHMVDLLIRQDKMTMAHSLEGRVPFLDRELIAFVRSLPSNMFVGTNFPIGDKRMQNTKKLLKKLALRYFSPDFVFRPKSGFSLPLLAYYKDPRFVALMEDKLLPGIRHRGIVDPEKVRQWWGTVQDQPRTLDESFWIPIAFEIWAQQWLDGKPEFSCS